ncbi:MAG: segregation/condensation protein A, partial [Clostridiales bacterium]|nr:segregation/condensation protein A [Clostridiales bacterium]
MKNINVKLEAFEGPFDLLFHLIEKNEIQIYDIPISILTNQFLEYTMDNRDMENISEFLVMASTLLEIKSKMLLPKPKIQADEGVDPREELVTRLIEYKYFKSASEIFKQSEIFSDKVFFRHQESELIEKLIGDKLHRVEDYLQDVPIGLMQRVFFDALNRQEQRKDKIRFSFNSVRKDAFTVEKQMKFINKLIKNNHKIVFQQIFFNANDKIEIVVTFLAILEMVKLKLIKTTQNNIFGDIIIKGY